MSQTLRGTRALFIPGPTNVPERVRQALNAPMQDQRAPDLPSLIMPLFEDLKTVFRLENGRVFLFPASGTGGWEAAMTNTLSPGDQVLIARFGQFSNQWARLSDRLGFQVDAVDVDWGEGVPVEIFAEKLAADRTHQIKAVLVTHNETATGVTSDVAAVRRAMDAADHPALLFVDGVSSIASIDFRMEEWRVDLAASGSQKGFMLPPGLSILAVSEKAMVASGVANSRRAYFEFGDMVAANEKGYFPYTPPTHLFRGLRVSVDMLLEEGLDAVFARHHRLAEAVRKAVAAWGLRLCAKDPKWYSDTVSTILLPEGVDGRRFIGHAYDRYGISYGLGFAGLNGKAFRIGHLGDLNETMIMSVLGGTELVMRDFGLPFTAGSGVGAAVEHLYRSIEQLGATSVAA